MKRKEVINVSDFKGFDINLYENADYDSIGDAATYSSWTGGNSSMSIACSILTNLTENRYYCGGGTFIKT